MTTTSTKRLIVILCWALCASGCALLPSFGSAKKQEVARYVLEAPEVAKNTIECDSLMISVVRAAPGFGGTGLLYSASESRVKRYAYAQWADTLPHILRTVLTQSLSGAGVFSSVLNGPVPSPTVNRLDLVDIQLLQRYPDAKATESIVEFDATLRLFGLNPNVLLHTERLSLQEKAGVGPEEAVKATQRMVVRLMPELIEKTRKACIKN